MICGSFFSCCFVLGFIFHRSNSWDVSFISPSKINLFLRVLGRRENGYHDLASLFQCISLSDKMLFRKLPNSSEKDIMTCSDASLEIDDRNLVIKAFNLMRQKTGIRQHFEVHLDKLVPIQAGLGGGSGNAATAMHAFNYLCGFPASLVDLEKWSGDIGSDITFFFSSGTAYCTGRGELIQSLPPLKDASHTEVHILKPREGLSTGLVFKTMDIKEVVRGRDPLELLDSFETKGALEASRSGSLINDLELPAMTLLPKLASIRRELLNLGSREEVAGAMMSGSGTSVYCLADQRVAVSLSERIAKLTAHHEGEDLKDVRHFPCTFVNKPVDVTQWYQ